MVFCLSVSLMSVNQSALSTRPFLQHTHTHTHQYMEKGKKGMNVLQYLLPCMHDMCFMKKTGIV